MEEQVIEMGTFKKIEDNKPPPITVPMQPQSDTRTATSDEDSEKKSNSLHKSRITNTLTENFGSQMDLTIEQLEKDHYRYRRGSTQVHVQTYAASTAENIVNDGRTQMFYNGLKLISALFGMLLFLISLSIKMSSAITTNYENDQVTTNATVSELVVDQYNLVLYVFGSLWGFFYLFKGTFRSKDEVKFLKSHQSSNRWLKGVVILFGLGIILKDGLTFISYLMVDLTICYENNIKIAVAVFQVLFIISQTKYIFRFSKAYIRNCNAGSSSGLMIIIAINLSTWASAVIDETIHALHLESDHSGEGEHPTQYPPNHNSTKAMFSGDIQPLATGGENNQCACDSDFCVAASTANTFLFPFLIEYSLVASCMLYVVWNNVGKMPPPCEGVVKPSYKFYGRYKGSTAALVVFFLTIVFLILLGTSATDTNQKTYLTELLQLNLFMCFMGALEFVMVLVTIVGLYLFYRICRPLEKTPMLDQVLLIVCVVGPFMYNTFSMIAVIAARTKGELEGTWWIFSLLQPLIDQLQCLLQLIFILYGLRREPITSASAKETAAQLRHGIHEHFNRSNEDEQASEAAFDNKTFLRSRRSSVTSAVTRIATAHEPTSTPPTNRTFLAVDDQRFSPKQKRDNLPPDIVISPSDDGFEKPENQSDKSKEDSLDGESDEYKQTIFKIVSETQVARPDTMRFRLRDVMIFLLGTNACLWLFMSLNGTAFTIYQYESEFFGPSAWTIITMVCRPLVIFFRMHSAGCLFEMWSYA